MSSPCRDAATSILPSSPIRAGTGAMPPVMAMRPVTAAVVVPSFISAVMSRSVLPSRSVPPAAARGDRFGRVRCASTLLRPLACGRCLRRRPGDGAARRSPAGPAHPAARRRSGRSDRRRTGRVSGQVRVGLGPWRADRSDRRCQRCRRPARRSGHRRRLRLPILIVPLASGLRNGPCTLASTRTDCQDTPGAGVMAGAWALTARSAVSCCRSTVPLAEAVNWPAVMPTCVARLSRGPLTEAWIAIAPRSGRWAMPEIRPLAGSSALTVASIASGVTRPLTT